MNDHSCDYNEAFVYYQSGNFAKAKPLYERCLGLYGDENELHPATIATRYKLACVAMRQGHVKTAM